MKLALREFEEDGGDALMASTFGQFVPPEVASVALREIAEWPALERRFVIVRTY